MARTYRREQRREAKRIKRENRQRAVLALATEDAYTYARIPRRVTVRKATKGSE